MKRAIKFLRTAMDPASAPSEAHKASIEFFRELRSHGTPLQCVEDALRAASGEVVETAPKMDIEALRKAFREQEEQRAISARTIKFGIYRGRHTSTLSNQDLYSIEESHASHPSDKGKARKELEKRGL